MFMKERKPVIK